MSIYMKSIVWIALVAVCYPTAGFADQAEVIHTSKVRLQVGADARVGYSTYEGKLTYFTDDYQFLTDGSLLIGNYDGFDTTMYWSVYGDIYPDNGHIPFLPDTEIEVDSVSDPNLMTASGGGRTSDGLFLYDVTYYASQHADSSDMILAFFEITYTGPDTLEDVLIGYYADFDIPSDLAPGMNSAGYITNSNTFYLRGAETGSPNQYDQCYGGLLSWDGQYTAFYTGIVWDNAAHLDSRPGFLNGGLNPNEIYQVLYTSVGEMIEPPADPESNYMNGSALLSAYRGTFPPNVTYEVAFILIATNPNVGGAGYASLHDNALTGKQFSCDRELFSGQCLDAAGWIMGDADGNGVVEISDVVCLICYIFIPGSPPPFQTYSGDADCSTVVEIADAVYIIEYIFIPGSPAPGNPDGLPPDDCYYGADFCFPFWECY